jgi:hypothetical protein
MHYILQNLSYNMHFSLVLQINSFLSIMFNTCYWRETNLFRKSYCSCYKIKHYTFLLVQNNLNAQGMICTVCVYHVCDLWGILFFRSVFLYPTAVYPQWGGYSRYTVPDAYVLFIFKCNKNIERHFSYCRYLSYSVICTVYCRYMIYNMHCTGCGDQLWTKLHFFNV